MVNRLHGLSGALISRATPGETTRAGIRQGAGGEDYNLSAGSSQKLIELSLSRGSFSISGAGPLDGSPDPGGESWPGPAGDSLGVILERVAKRSEGDIAGIEKTCPAGVITGSCENGHRFAKEVYCGREWCKTCNGKWEKGQDMKPTHGRRFSRWYPKAQQFDSMGYWTFTIPQELRSKYRTKKALGDLGHQVQELLKSYHYARGLRRWHYFGDKSERWHPHLNCLVDGGPMSRRDLRSLRLKYSRILDVKLAIAEYHYLDTPGQKVHALKYITRATFLDARWDVPMALELRGFRNQLWWGSKQWDREPVWSLDDLPGEPPAAMSDTDTRAVASLEDGKCPYDGLPITWERFLPAGVLPELGGRNIGAGYWELPYVRPPPYRLDFSRLGTIDAPPRNLSKTPGRSYVSADIARSIWAEFVPQMRRRVEYRRWREALKSGDPALMAEVLERPEKSFGIETSPAFSYHPDTDSRKPNCLGGVSLVGEN